MRSVLYIDRLSITLPVERSDHEVVLQNLAEHASTGLITQEQNPYSALLKSYRFAYHIHFDERTTCIVQVAPRAYGSRYIRLEWNPAKARKAHRNPMGRIMEMLQTCLPNYSPNLVLEANITRIDLSFRLYGVSVDSILVCTILRKPLSGRYFAPHVDQYLLIYDKKLEIASRQIGQLGKHHGRETSTTRVRHAALALTQFELRLRSVGTFENLASIPNPFETYTVTSYERAKHLKVGHQWVWFVDSCKMRGAQAALSMIEDRRERTKYRRELETSGQPSWWNPTKIWAELPHALSRMFGVAYNY
jgi:hypothetical protein